MKFQKRQSLGETYITSSLLQNNGGFLTNFGFNFQTLELIDKISIIKLGLLANTKITRHTTRPNHGHFDSKVLWTWLTQRTNKSFEELTTSTFSWHNMWCSLAFGGALWCFFICWEEDRIMLYIYIILFIYLFIPWYFLWRYGGLGNKQNHFFFWGCSTFHWLERELREVIISMLFHWVMVYLR
jgi:hypothetical protein